MKTVFHPSNERGHADHGWLNARHSFSFASWYDPSKIHFGMLRVLNDDTVAPGKGFGLHPHNDMEIITVPLSGSLQHRDDMGNTAVIHAGDVQVMSAGTGVFHSEFNPSESEPVSLFQLWIFPKEKGIAPRYDQKYFSAEDSLNNIQTLASGFKRNGELYIHQDAAVSRLRMDAGKSMDYPVGYAGNGAYVLVVEGAAEVAGITSGRRDAVGVWETDRFTLKANTATEFLIIEVPMN